jgi:mannosyltransferase
MHNATAATAVERSPAPGVLRLPGLVVIAFLVGALTSFAWSWIPSLWTDEAATISAASRPLDRLLAMAQTIDAVHATYYALMHLWLQVVPTEALWLRLPSAVVTGATTAGLLLVGRRLGGARTGVLASPYCRVRPGWGRRHGPTR